MYILIPIDQCRASYDTEDTEVSFFSHRLATYAYCLTRGFGVAGETFGMSD